MTTDNVHGIPSSYLGEGVTASWHKNRMIRLVAERPGDEQHTIYLEYHVWQALKAYVDLIQRTVETSRYAKEPDSGRNDK